MIGLIFGETEFPKYIYKKIKDKKKYILIDLTNNKTFKKDKKSHSFSIGQFGKIISIFKNSGCKKVLFAGRVNKPTFSMVPLKDQSAAINLTEGLYTKFHKENFK